jgi:hypothetical protein
MSKQRRKCPFAAQHGARTTASMQSNADWWPNQLNLGILHQHGPEVQPAGQGLQLRRGIQEARPGRAEEGPHRPDDRLPGLVAGRLGPLRRPLHPHGLAQRRHLPHLRRARRRRHTATSASRRSTAGPTTSTSTRRAACCGRSSRSTATGSPGPTSIILAGNVAWNPWASRPSASPAGARTSTSRKRTSTGAERPSGWATSATAASVSSRTPWPPCRWA